MIYRICQMSHFTKSVMLKLLFVFSIQCSHIPHHIDSQEYGLDKNSISDIDAHPQSSDNEPHADDVTNPQGWNSSNCAHIMADGECAHPTGPKK